MGCPQVSFDVPPSELLQYNQIGFSDDEQGTSFRFSHRED
jgi:hypothetical protein